MSDNPNWTEYFLYKKLGLLLLSKTINRPAVVASIVSVCRIQVDIHKYKVFLHPIIVFFI